MSALVYEPLDPSKKTIRLLEVLPGGEDDLIRCTLSHADLDDHPYYIALSYMWAQVDGYQNIECCGVVIQVGQNLWDFLRQFRKWDAMRGTRLWIDAVCINQSEVAERNHQVSQMRDVYSMAESVITWLGRATHNDEPALLAASIGARQHHSMNWKVLSSMKTVLRKPYWSRVWIIQELLLAQSWEIWCGKYRSDASSINEIVAQSPPWPSMGKTLLEYKEFWAERSHSDKSANRFRLRSLLNSCSASQCSDRFDKVYALLGIASDAMEQSNPIYPNYGKPAVEVLIDVLRNQHGRRRDGDILQHHFIEYLRQVLGVSRMELIGYILEKNPNIEPHIFILATGMKRVSSFHIIGSVSQWYDASDHDGQLPASQQLVFESFLAQSGVKHSGSFPSLRLNRPVWSETHVRDVITESTDGLMHHMMKEPIHLDNGQTHCSISAADVIDRLSRSFARSSESCYTPLDHKGNTMQHKASDYRAFECSEGVRGMMSKHVPMKKNVLVAVVSDALLPLNILVVISLEGHAWILLGFAFLTEFNPPVRLRWLLQRMFHIPQKLKDTGLMDLLFLYGCKMVDESQLRGILANSLGAEEAEEAADKEEWP